MGLGFGDLARVVAQVAQFGRDGASGREFVVTIPVLHDQLPAHFRRSEPGVEARGAKVGVGLALPIDNRLDIGQELRQMLLGAFAAAQREGIQAGHSAVEFAQPLTDRLAIPAEGAFGEALAPGSKFLDGTGEKASAVGSFERLGSLDQPSFACVGQVHQHSPEYGCIPILPHLGRFEFSDSLSEPLHIESDQDVSAFLERIAPLYFRDPEGEGVVTLREYVRRNRISITANNATETSDGRFLVRDKLNTIDVPTLVLVGRRDFICSPVQAQIIHEGISVSDI